MRALLSGGGLVLALSILPAAAAADPISGYDGSLPFRCMLQQAGTGVDFENDQADPFCVEYDKTHQNVTEGGVIEFLSKEPARVAAASPKCFYFQRDHWRGSIVQGDERTETYNWDGSYWFDKARGAGGVYVENFTFNNQTQDPTKLPGFPEEWKPYFGPGRGGIQAEGSVETDPRCRALAKEQNPLAGAPDRCHDYRGSVRAGIGAARLGMTRQELEDALGPPARELRGFLRFCLADGGKLAVALRSGRAVFALTTSPGFDARGLRVGDRARALRGKRRLLLRRGRSRVFAAGGGRRWRLLMGVRAGRIHYLAAASRTLSRRQLAAYLTRSR